MSEKQVTHCPICGVLLTNIVSGAMCTSGPDLHGRIYPRLTGDAAQESNRFHANKDLPAAECLPVEYPVRDVYANRHLYIFEGKKGLWRRLTMADGKKAEAGKIGRDEEYRARVYVRDRALEERMREALFPPEEDRPSEEGATNGSV